MMIFTVFMKSCSFTVRHFSSNKYLNTGNILHLHYKDGEVKAVKEIIIVYSEKYMKSINAHCEINAVISNWKPGGIYQYLPLNFKVLRPESLLLTALY